MDIETPGAPAEGQSQPATEPKPGAGAPPPKESAAERRLRLKVNGQDVEWEESRVIAEAQKSAAARQRFEEAAREKREMQALLGRFQKDPDAVIKALAKKEGLDVAEFYREQFARHLKQRMMTPEQREQAQRLSEYERLKEEHEQLKQERENERVEVAKEKYREQYDRDLSAAFQGIGIPVNRFTIEKAVALAEEYIGAGMDPDWKAIAQGVDEDYFGGAMKSLESIDDLEALKKRLSPELRKKLRKLELQELDGGSGRRPQGGKKSPAELAQEKRQEEKKPMSMAEVEDYLEKLKERGD